MIEDESNLYDIPASKRRILILAIPRTGSSVLQRIISYCLELTPLTPEIHPIKEKEYKQELKKIIKYSGLVSKFDPTLASPEFLEFIIHSFHRVVILIRENIVDHGTSNARASLYSYNGAYDLNDEVEEYIENNMYKATKLLKSLRAHLSVVELAVKYKIPILTYESLYTEDRSKVIENLKFFGVKKHEIGEERFNRALELFNPRNKYTNSNSIIKDTKKLKL